MLGTSRRDTCHSVLYMQRQARMLFLLHHTTSVKFVFKPREEFWKWIITIRHTQWLGKVDDYIHVQKRQHCLFVTGMKDRWGATIAKAALLIKRVTAGSQSMQQPKELGQQCWAFTLSSLGLQGLRCLTPIIHTLKCH